MIIDLNQILSIFNIDYEIVKENNNLWNANAENCLLKYFGKVR